VGSAILFAAAAIMVRLTSANDVALSDRTVRLSDVAELAGTDAPAFHDIVIAALKDSGAPQEVRRIDVAHLIRRALPAAKVIGTLSGSIRIHAPPTALVPPSTYADDPEVRRGDKLTVTSTVGPVAIQRQVVALQQATARQKRVFVRSSDGEIFSAPLQAGDAR
jgi:hypothetical protein